MPSSRASSTIAIAPPVFARYALAGTLVAAVGSLAAGTPSVIGAWTGWPQRTCLQAMFIVYAVLGVAIALVYRGLPRSFTSTAKPVAPLGPSRRAVFTLAALFSLDSFGGGFVVQSLVAVVAVPALRPVACIGRNAVLRDRRDERAVVPCRGTHRQAHRASSIRWCSRTCRRTYA
jgi:hypothetical protein